MGQKKRFIKIYVENWNFNIFFFLLLFIPCANCSITDETTVLSLERPTTNYVDPHSFYYNKHSKTEKLNPRRAENDNSVTLYTSYQQCHECRNEKMRDISDVFFSRRIINLLLTRVNFQVNDDSLLGIIAIKITPVELKKLESFAMGKVSIRDIDSIISNIFKAPKQNMFLDASYYIKHLIMQVFLHKDIVIATLVIFYMAWIILTTRWKYRSMLRLVGITFMIVFAASFIVTWYQLIKQAEIKHAVKEMMYPKLPVHCQPDQMSWWDRIWNMFSLVESCHEYFEARMENPFVQVTPAQALSHMIATIILQPVQILGTALGDFSHLATKHMIAPVRIIVEPLLVVGIVILVVVVGCLLPQFRIFSSFPSTKSDCSSNHMAIKCEDRREPIKVLLSVELQHDNSTPQLTTRQTSAENNDVNITSECIMESKKKITNNSSALVQNEKSHSHINPASGDSNSLKILSILGNDKCLETHNSTIEEIKPESGSSDN